MEILTVKLQDDGYLVNGNISVPDAEDNGHYHMVQAWIEEGNTPEPQYTQEELNTIAGSEAKQTKLKALSKITVTTSNGNTFDGDHIARGDMNSVLASSSTLEILEIEWKMADNTWVTVGLDEIREALALSILSKGDILRGS